MYQRLSLESVQEGIEEAGRIELEGISVQVAVLDLLWKTFIGKLFGSCAVHSSKFIVENGKGGVPKNL